MKTLHSPHPWRIGTGNGYNPSQIVDANGNGVAQVYGIPLHTRIDELGKSAALGLSNARLIAAAPELLAALEALVMSNTPDTYDSAMSRARLLLERCGGAA